MTKPNTDIMDPLIEGYLSYLEKVGRKTPRTIIDVRCTLRRAIAGFGSEVPLWHLELKDYLHWLEAERQKGSTETTLAKYLSHVRGLLEYAWRSGRTERNVLDGFSLQHTIRRTPPKSLTLEEAERLVEATVMPGPAARRAGLPDSVTPRTLRHSFATHLMDRGVDLAVIASLMGHRSPQETGVYLHVLPGRSQAAVRKLPLGGRS